MRLPPEGARWLVAVRWLACAVALAATWLGSTVYDVLSAPRPMYIVGCGIGLYNVALWLSQRGWRPGERAADRKNIAWQVCCDMVALTLLLYFSDMPRNPFLFYFTFHMIISGMYLRGSMPYLVAGVASCLVGATLLLVHLDWLPYYPIHFPGDTMPLDKPGGFRLLVVFAALSSTVWIAVYFTTSIRRYVDRAHATLRQKEKLLGIGQLVAGIAHEIANPLDGVQNCLQSIGERVKDDPHLAEYVQLMAEALERIERTAKRVQGFARPAGITLESTDVAAAVQATLHVLGLGQANRIQIKADVAKVPPVQGDPYTLQEVLFNLCTNAIHAMPQGGTLSIRARAMGSSDEDQMGSVAIEVSDTGVGIPASNLDKIFEPFFTTRAETGGTGLGLGLCRMLISEMGGRIEVRSVLGRGSTFTVLLNPAPPPPAKATKPSGAAESPATLA